MSKIWKVVIEFEDWETNWFVSYKIIGNWMELQFQNVMGEVEVLKLERYYNWLNEKREQKISKLLK